MFLQLLTSPCMLRAFFFSCYANETARGICPVVWWGKMPLGAPLTLEFPNTDVEFLPNGQWLLVCNFSCNELYSHWECVHNIQMLCSSPDRHLSKSGGPGGKSGQNLPAPHEARLPMLLIPGPVSRVWSLEWTRQPQWAQQKPTGPEFRLNVGTVGRKHPLTS